MAEQAMTGRTFPSGATRDQDDTKPSYRGFLCPLVQRRFGEYMLEHQRLPDGTKREPDNWKKGIPSKAYLESLGRHVQELTEQFEFGAAVSRSPVASRDFDAEDVKKYEDTLSAILFNVQGLLRNSLIGRNYQRPLPKPVQGVDTAEGKSKTILRNTRTGEEVQVTAYPGSRPRSPGDDEFLRSVQALRYDAMRKLIHGASLPGVHDTVQVWKGDGPPPGRVYYNGRSWFYGEGPGEVPQGHLFGKSYVPIPGVDTEEKCRVCGFSRSPRPSLPTGPPTYGGCMSKNQRRNHDFSNKVR